MPLTRGKKTEQVPCETAAGSDEENGDFEGGFTSDQERENSSKEDPTELRKLELAQVHEYRLKKLEMQAKAQAEKRQIALQMERERL